MAELPKRKNPRLRDYDYGQSGAYFITICTQDHREIFGSIINEQMILSKYGQIVKQEIESISSIRKECEVTIFVVMPNHIHLIVEIDSEQTDTPVGADGNPPAVTDNVSKNRQPVGADGNPPEPHGIQLHNVRADCHPPLRIRQSVSNMVQGLKGAVARRIGLSVWQRSFHDHIIRNDEDYRRIWDYIAGNPSNWRQDCFCTLPN